eukprot:m.183125 g.183125  ORF g.183125 m.183125 type:complete len:815 (-) comp17468_c0_seq1:1612-4056(-)
MSDTLQTGDALLAELEAELQGTVGTRTPDPGTPISTPSTPKRNDDEGEPVPRREFVALQQEIVELKAAQYEATNREKALKAELAKLTEHKDVKKGVLDNIFRRDKDKGKVKKGSESEPEDEKQKEVQRLTAQVKTLEAENSLHKETKDQLARELDSTRADLDDQRMTFKASIASLNLRNAQLEEVLRANNLESLIPSQADCLTPAKSSPTVSTSESPEHHISVEQAAMLQEALQEKELLAARVARMEGEAVGNMTDLETLRAQIRKLNKENERLQRAMKTTRSQVKDLQAEIQTKDVTIEKERECSKRLVEEIASLDVKLKWHENKLQAESERAEGLTQELTKVQKRAKELKEENEQVKDSYKGMVESLQHTNQVSATAASGLESAMSILQRELAEARKQCATVQAELQKTQEELGNVKIELKGANDCFHAEQAVTTRLKEQVDELREKTLGYDDMRENLQSTMHAKKALEQENKLLIESTERGSAAFTTAQQQIEQLQAEKRASEEHVRELNASLHGLERKVADEQEDVRQKAAAIKELQEQLDAAKEHSMETESRAAAAAAAAEQQREALASEVSALQARCNSLQTELDDAHSALQLQKKKAASALKDMARQLQTAEKRARPRNGMVDSPDHDGASVYSSESNEDRDQFGRAGSQSDVLSPPSSSRSGGGSASAALRGVTNVGRMAEDMNRLMHELEKRNERISFYESHVATLTEDLKSKGKIIQQFLLREQTGALGPSSLDANKLERTKQRGMMASVFKGSTSKEVTVEMAMEINAKLQEVLEDTLLKNIQLKDSLDVLSQEIDRLRRGSK